MEERVKKYWRNHSKKTSRFTVRRLGLEYVFFRTICAFYRMARMERKNRLQMKYDHFFHLIYAKNFMVETGKEYFTVSDVRKFMRDHTGRMISATAIYEKFMVLMKFDLVMIVDKDPKRDWGVRFALTIRAREFFRAFNEFAEI